MRILRTVLIGFAGSMSLGLGACVTGSWGGSQLSPEVTRAISCAMGSHVGPGCDAYRPPKPYRPPASGGEPADTTAAEGGKGGTGKPDTGLEQALVPLIVTQPTVADRGPPWSQSRTCCILGPHRDWP